MRLKLLFKDWVDFDIAQYYLACSLGILAYQEDLRLEFNKVRGLFENRNRVGGALFQMLEQMVNAGMLERHDDLGYRWNDNFMLFWEGGKDGLT